MKKDENAWNRNSRKETRWKQKAGRKTGPLGHARGCVTESEHAASRVSGEMRGWEPGRWAPILKKRPHKGRREKPQ